MRDLMKLFDDMYEQMTPEQKAEWDEMDRQMELSEVKGQQKAGKLFEMKREQYSEYMRELNYNYPIVLTSLTIVENSLKKRFSEFGDLNEFSTIVPDTQKLFNYSFKDVKIEVEKLDKTEAENYYRSIKTLTSFLETDYLAFLNHSLFQYTTKTLIELLHQTTWNEVLEGLKTIYPSLDKDSVSLYQKAFDTALDLEAVPEDREKELVIDVQNKNNVYGRYKGTLEVFALGLTRWGDWLASFISSEQVKTIGKGLYVALILDEMTTYGWEPSDITEVNADIEDKIDRINNLSNEKND